MKKSLLIASTLAMVLGVGVAVGARQQKTMNVEQVEAAAPSSYKKVYRFSVPNDFGSDVGNKIYLHVWGSATPANNTTWGNFKTVSDYSYNENSERVYTFATNVEDYTGIIVIRYDDNPDYCKTADITIGSNTAWSWDGTNGASPSSWTPVDQTYYFYDYTNMFNGEAKCYAWQSGGSLNNAAYPGPVMTKVQYGSGQLYSVTLDPAFDKFKIGIGDSSNTGDQWINQHRGECFAWWKADDSSWVSADNAKAHDWIFQTMHMRDISTDNTSDTNACRDSGTGAKSYYATAKAAYNSFTAGVKTELAKIDGFNNAKARFVAWAAANGETASFDGTALSISNAVAPLSTTSIESNSGAVIVIIAATVAAIAAGLFFILKKKETK